MNKRKIFNGKMKIIGAVLAAGLLVSCGSQPGKADEAAAVDGGAAGSGAAEADDAAGQVSGKGGEGTGEPADSGGKGGETQEDTGQGGQAGAGADQARASFDYNHEYNEIIRYYQGNIFLSKEDGIYFFEDGTGDGKLIFQNPYKLRRGMEIDQGSLYFCGSAQRGNEEASTVYRIDLDTLEVEDALAAISRKFDVLYSVSVYEGKLYVSDGEEQRIGFELDGEGNVIRQLDEKAEDFLYREYNEYMELELAKRNGASGEEYDELVEAQMKMYQAVMDVAACKKMLQGIQVVSRYKDELQKSIYLEYENGIYEYLCDVVDFPMLVTETGLYYAAEESGEIWYMDFYTKNAEKIFEQSAPDRAEISLVNYDADYVYLLQKRHIEDEGENGRREEVYLFRAPRWGGDAQEVYRIEDEEEKYAANGWYRNCGVYDGRMYLAGGEVISLEPESFQ